MDGEGNIRMLEQGELRQSLAEKDKLFAEISNLIVEADVDEEDEDNPPDVTVDEYDRLVSQVCSLHAAFEDPARASRPTSGFEGDIAGPQLSSVQATALDDIDPNPTTAIGDDAQLNEALQLN